MKEFLWRLKHSDKTLTRLSPMTGTLSPWENWHNLSRKQVPIVDIYEPQLQDETDRVKLPFANTNCSFKIMGWGAFSFAVRLADQKCVAVLKPVVDHTQMYGDLRPNYPGNLALTKYLGDYIPPSYILYTEGINGLPSLTKVSPEIPGRTLFEYPFWSILSNKELSKSLCGFLDDVLACHRETGYLADVTGHVNSTFILRLLREFWPFYSKNLVVEDGSSKVHFIDTSVYPDSDNPDQITKLKRKLITDVRVVNYYLGMMLLKTVGVLHTIRDQIVTEGATSAEYQTFKKGFVEVITKLNESGLNYRVVGSCGLTATLAQYGVDFSLSPRRANRTIRDIDIIVLDPKKEITSIKEFFDQKTKSIHGYPEVSLSPTCDNTDLNKFPALCFNSRDESGMFCKQYEELRLPFTEKDISPLEVELFGIKFNTFLPEIQTGLYLIRGGSFKFKDLVKMSLLCETTGCIVPIKFRDFGTEIRRRYSRKHKLFELKELLNFWSGGMGIVAKRELKTKLPPRFIEFGKKLLSKVF